MGKSGQIKTRVLGKLSAILTLQAKARHLIPYSGGSQSLKWQSFGILNMQVPCLPSEILDQKCGAVRSALLTRSPRDSHTKTLGVLRGCMSVDKLLSSLFPLL